MTRRLVLSSVALTVLILLALEIPLGITATRQSRENLALELERDANVLGDFAEEALEGSEELDLQTVVENYEAETGARAVIIDADGVAVADSSPTGDVDRSFASRPEVADALAGGIASGTRRSDTLDTNLSYVAVPVASGGTVHGVVRLSYPTSEVDERTRDVWLTLGGVAIVSIVAAAVIGWILARSVTRPLRRLQEAATGLGGGDLTSRAPTGSGPPEVRSLATAFNDTGDRLAELVAAQDAFVADASHQLRTPLTALRLRLENLEAGAAPDGREDAQAALAEVTRLSRLVDGLLALARAERAGAPAPSEPLDLGAALDERADVWTPVAEEKDVAIVVRADRGVAALATPDRLSQVLDNLLANALEVVPAQSTITLTARAEPSAVSVHVVDEGPGMDAEHRRHAFNRFWRGDAGHRGSGLGLSIVQKLVQADGGEVTLHEAASGGLDVRIRLRPAG